MGWSDYIIVKCEKIQHDVSCESSADNTVASSLLMYYLLPIPKIMFINFFCPYGDDKSNRFCWLLCLFVCVEVLRPSQPIRVMSCAVSLPNYTFSWTVSVLLAVNQYLWTFFRQKLTSAPLESAKGREWPLKIFHNQSSRNNVARPSGDYIRYLLITSRMGIRLSYQGQWFVSYFTECQWIFNNVAIWKLFSTHLYILLVYSVWH